MVVVPGDGPSSASIARLMATVFSGLAAARRASVDFIYLAPDGGARVLQVRDLCEVTGIWRAPAEEGGGYAVHFQDLVAKGVEEGTRQAAWLSLQER